MHFLLKLEVWQHGIISHVQKQNASIVSIFVFEPYQLPQTESKVGFRVRERGIFSDLPWRCSACGMYANYGIYNLEAIIRKQTFGFIGRLCKSCNTIVQTLENAWIIRIQ